MELPVACVDLIIPCWDGGRLQEVSAPAFSGNLGILDIGIPNTTTTAKSGRGLSVGAV